MATNYKYFIEDTETNQWFANTLHLQPKIHTFGRGWDKPFVSAEQYWTSDPNQAFCWFKDRQDAQEFLDKNIREGYLEFMKLGTNNVLRDLIVTEHEFVDGTFSAT